MGTTPPFQRSGSGRYRPHGGGSAFALRNITTERATTLVASRALVFATSLGLGLGLGLGLRLGLGLGAPLPLP